MIINVFPVLGPDIIGNIVDISLEANGSKFCALRDTGTKEDIVVKIIIISNTLLLMVKRVKDPGNDIHVNIHFNDFVNKHCEVTLTPLEGSNHPLIEKKKKDVN